MRCSACDKKLTAVESVRRHAMTGAFLDTCNECLKAISDAGGFIPVKDNPSIFDEEDPEVLDTDKELCYPKPYSIPYSSYEET